VRLDKTLNQIFPNTLISFPLLLIINYNPPLNILNKNFDIILSSEEAIRSF